jgi:hypothetical protein
MNPLLYFALEEIAKLRKRMSSMGSSVAEFPISGILENPNGSVTANPGRMYVDRVRGRVWIKCEGSGNSNTGWI